MRKQSFLPLLMLFILLVWTTGCRRQPAATPQAAASPTPAAATATIPPVASPTIPIPQATEPPTAEPATPTVEASATPVPVPEVIESRKALFAEFKEAPVEAVPALFHDPIAPDLGNVVVPFVLSEAQRERLAADGIVVSPGTEKEFFTVYELARYANVPIFVTSDSLLHSYHLLFDKVLRTAESGSFIPLLGQLNQAMLAETDAQYQALQGTAWEDAARRTVAFVAVGSKLLDPAVPVPAYVQELVEAELALIEAAAGIQPSPIFPGLAFGEDYTQYIPRGHYTRSEALSSYFKSMMWYGRMTFRLKTEDPQVGRAETRSALLLVHALKTAQVDGRPALDAWLDLYNPTAFLVGRSDDLTALQYLDVMDAVYGEAPAPAQLTDEALLDAFITAADELPPPRILGLVIGVDDDETETTKGFRFMGQRFVPDAYIFRQLIYRNVGTPDNPRMLPMGLDVMAAMGSERAYTILDNLGETAYAGYPEQMNRMQAWVGGLSPADWTETLYTTWLYTLQPLLEVLGEGYPQFMQSDVWLDKQLNTSLGSWAELKHDTILYAKQVYAELGGGGGGAPTPLLARGYVEPVPHFYARLSALAAMTQEGLGERGLLAEQDADSLQRLQELADAFQVMAEKELRGEPLTEEEYYLIRFYGGELEHLVMASADTDGDGNIPVLDEDPQAAVIADVATAPDPDGDGTPNPVVLEEAVGRINELYAVVPLINEDGSVTLQVAKGGTFAYYEFPWPADDRLTDEAWRQMLDEGQAPPPPEWTGSFLTTETEHAEFQQAIYRFQSNISQAYWNLETEFTLNPATDAVRAQFQAVLDELAAAQQYIGRQWIHASYRSFDIQAEDRVVVTVRETWEDALYQYDEGPGDFNVRHTPVAHRGPYTLDVTYTLVPDEFGWQVSNVVFANEPPDWQE